MYSNFRAQIKILAIVLAKEATVCRSDSWSTVWCAQPPAQRAVRLSLQFWWTVKGALLFHSWLEFCCYKITPEIWELWPFRLSKECWQFHKCQPSFWFEQITRRNNTVKSGYLTRKGKTGSESKLKWINVLKGSKSKISFSSRLWCKSQEGGLRGLNGFSEILPEIQNFHISFDLQFAPVIVWQRILFCISALLPKKY